MWSIVFAVSLHKDWVFLQKIKCRYTYLLEMPPKSQIKPRNRRRLGARKYKNYSEEMLLLAVELVKNKNTSSYDAEKQFGIPRRTIEKRVKNLHSDKPGPRFRLSKDEEQKFVKVLIAAGDFGCPLGQLDFKLAVYDYLKKNNKTYLFNNQVPGDWWIKSFLERHRDQLTLRSTQNITKARAERTLDELKEYFANLEISLQNVPPTNVLNYDETNVSDDPGSSKCIFRRGVKYPERIVNHSKGCISLMFAGTADGELLPPYVVYKAENLWTEWCNGGPEGARYNRTKSGWFDSVIFLDWFINIVIPWATQLEGPKIIIGDNLSSHLNPDVVELCEAHQIRFVFLPPRSTHLTQPLDVAFFGPLKKEWRKILLQYKMENPKQASLNKNHFPFLLKQLMDAANIKKQNMLSGFKATGIHPFNPYEVYKKLPEYEDDIRYDVDQTLLDYLKDKKRPNPIQRRKNNKLNVPSGKSVSSVDISSTTSEPKTKKKTTEKKTLLKIATEQKNESKLEQIEIAQIASKTLNNDDRKLIPKKRQKRRVEISSDSESSCSIPSSDSSEYDPRNDEDTEIESLVDIDCEEHLEDQHENGGYVEIADYMKLDGDEEVQNVKEIDQVLESQETNMEDMGVCNSSKESSKGERIVTVLSDIRNTVENRTYFDLRKYGPFTLEEIKTDQIVNVKTKSKNIHNSKINNKTIKTECVGLIHTRPTKMTQLPSPNMTSNTDWGAGCSKGPELNTTPIFYNVNDTVLVRYILKKRIQYFVGKILAKVGGNYKVLFFKRSGRNDNTKFTLPKKEDIDTIDEGMIVKGVQLLALNEKETEYVFLDDDDLVYFD